MESECKGMVRAGWVMTLLAALPFLLSCFMKLTGNPQVVQGFGHFGWPETMIVPLGILEAACVVVYLVPPVSVLGAIVLTGFLGGAMATHLRIGEPVYLHVAIGILIWGGLFLRDSRLRELLPVRTQPFLYERDITINRPLGVVYAHLRPLKNFQAWNPFLKNDLNAKVEFRGKDGEPGFVVAWDGNRETGSGEQEITKIIDGQKIEFELRFKKPFRGTNRGYFAVESVAGGQTRVRWGMSGRPSFPMSVFGLFINCDKMIGKQFDAGLAQLKNILEK